MFYLVSLHVISTQILLTRLSNSVPSFLFARAAFAASQSEPLAVPMTDARIICPSGVGETLRCPLMPCGLPHEVGAFVSDCLVVPDYGRDGILKRWGRRYGGVTAALSMCFLLISFALPWSIQWLCLRKTVLADELNGDATSRWDLALAHQRSARGLAISG